MQDSNIAHKLNQCNYTADEHNETRRRNCQQDEKDKHKSLSKPKLYCHLAM